MKITRWLVLAAAWGLGACAAPPSPTAAPAASAPPASLAGTRWVARGDASAETPNMPRLEFIREGRLAGYTGCNMLSGAWRMEGGEVRLGPIMTTKRACVGPEGETESRLMAALSEKSRVRREGAKLVVEAPEGARFEFTEGSGTY